ncbi:MAG: phosphohydrolase [Verrucomicrobia bacterium]|nr:phosphohydrolase [Verrucomicrobiota bacterium]
MSQSGYRAAIADYIRAQAKPPDKFSHQPRLYQLARRLAEDQTYDDDVLYAAAWMHDLGVFIEHRPEDPTALAAWDNVAYAIRRVPETLRQFGFPEDKIPHVLAVIQTHLPSTTPTSFEGTLLRDADILEQLGAIAILRVVSKVGRDTRFVRHGDAVRVLRKNLEQLPAQLRLACARRLAAPRIEILKAFLIAAENEADGSEL